MWRTLTMNLEKVVQLGRTYNELGAQEKDRLGAQVDTALERIDQEPKTVSWKIRSKIGDRVKWYQEVDEVS